MSHPSPKYAIPPNPIFYNDPNYMYIPRPGIYPGDPHFEDHRNPRQ